MSALDHNFGELMHDSASGLSSFAISKWENKARVVSFNVNVSALNGLNYSRIIKKIGKIMKIKVIQNYGLTKIFGSFWRETKTMY